VSDRPGKLRRTLLLGLLLVGAAGCGATLAIPPLRWRGHVVLLKLGGKFPELGWTDLIRMLPPWSPYQLQSITETRSAYATIRNPWASPPDIAAGKERFEERCTSCHQSGGGGAGPDLRGAAPRQGNSDWAVYRTIQDGVPGTEMPAHQLEEREAWQLVAHIQNLRRHYEPDSAETTWQVPAVTLEDLLRDPDDSSNWLFYHGSLSGWRYSRANQINRANVGRLRLQWMYQIEYRGVAAFETTPLVVGDVMYLTEPRATVVALDAGTGSVRWTYQPILPERLHLCCGAVNRGVSIRGNTLYLGTPDARLIALDAASGKPRWEVRLTDYRRGYSITSAPLIAGDLVVVGVAGGEFGIRGFIDGYDAETGKRVWRFHTVPEPGTPGSETWGGKSAETGGGGAWMTGSFDPGLDLIYIGTGNPGPVYNGDPRPGDNLYTSSVVALRRSSGALEWYFQFTPHDVHDYDAGQVPLLVDAPFGGRPRKLMLWANKNAFYYILDRENGEFLLARPFARQTWARSIDSSGRPVPAPGAAPSRQGAMVWPSQAGATNWWPPSYSPRTGMVYIPTREQGSVFFNRDEDYEPGQRFLGSRGQKQESDAVSALRALDALTGEQRWEYRYPSPRTSFPLGGTLSTAGELVFAGAGTELFAFHDRTGDLLWRFNAGGHVRAAPMTWYHSGRQRVSVAAGLSLLTFGIE
jgi:alcohol dehydrogenase (cytochrome c)